MRVQVKAEVAFSGTDEKLYERRLARLRRRLGRENGDHVTLNIQIEETPRTGEFHGSARLAIRDRVLVAERNIGETVTALLTQMFSDLERQIGTIAARKRTARHQAVEVRAP